MNVVEVKTNVKVCKVEVRGEMIIYVSRSENDNWLRIKTEEEELHGYDGRRKWTWVGVADVNIVEYGTE